jgi:hypothetical protein
MYDLLMVIADMPIITQVEERYGNYERVRSLFEAGVAADPGNKRLWGAFEAFEARRGSLLERQRVDSRRWGG